MANKVKQKEIQLYMKALYASTAYLSMTRRYHNNHQAHTKQENGE